MLRRINFQSIPVQDQQRALEFYRDTLGFEVQTDAAYDEHSRWIFMQISGAETMLHLDLNKSAPDSDSPGLCLVTDDTDAEADRLKSHGVSMKQGPMDAPWNPQVRYAMFEDSEGNLVMMQSSALEP